MYIISHHRPWLLFLSSLSQEVIPPVTPLTPMAHVRALKVIADSLLPSCTSPEPYSPYFLNNTPGHPFLSSFSAWPSSGLLLKPFSIYPCPQTLTDSSSFIKKSLLWCHWKDHSITSRTHPAFSHLSAFVLAVPPARIPIPLFQLASSYLPFKKVLSAFSNVTFSWALTQAELVTLLCAFINTIWFFNLQISALSLSAAFWRQELCLVSVKLSSQLINKCLLNEKIEYHKNSLNT